MDWGRLSQVEEPKSPTAAPVETTIYTTTYGYNLHDLLTSVAQDTVTRGFSYLRRAGLVDVYREKVLAVAVSRLRQMGREERAWASGTIILLSGILGIEDAVNERMKEAGMIDLMENKVVGPMLLQAEQHGRNEGTRGVLLEQLTEKFGPLPEWAAERLRSASEDELHLWAKRVLHSASLADTLA